MIHLTGTLTCPTLDDLTVIKTYLPDHIALSRAEPGCVIFEAVQTTDPMVWQIDETYTDRTSFDAHQTRNRASIWWEMSQGLVRDFKITEV